MSRSATEYLKHILDEFAFLENERALLSEDGFMRDPVRQRAFARSLEIIGEAAKQVPDDFRGQHPEIDWKGGTLHFVFTNIGFASVIFHITALEN